MSICLYSARKSNPTKIHTPDGIIVATRLAWFQQPWGRDMASRESAQQARAEQTWEDWQDHPSHAILGDKPSEGTPVIELNGTFRGLWWDCDEYPGGLVGYLIPKGRSWAMIGPAAWHARTVEVAERAFAEGWKWAIVGSHLIRHEVKPGAPKWTYYADSETIKILSEERLAAWEDRAAAEDIVAGAKSYSKEIQDLLAPATRKSHTLVTDALTAATRKLGNASSHVTNSAPWQRAEHMKLLQAAMKGIEALAEAQKQVDWASRSMNACQDLADEGAREALQALWVCDYAGVVAGHEKSQKACYGAVVARDTAYKASLTLTAAEVA